MQKECVYVIMLKIALLLVKIYVLVGKKGISELVSQVAAKPTAYLHLKNQVDNSIGKLCIGKANKTQKWVYNSEMNVKVCICDIRDVNQVNMGKN